MASHYLNNDGPVHWRLFVFPGLNVLIVGDHKAVDRCFVDAIGALQNGKPALQKYIQRLDENITPLR